jgi:hypothetical protein
MTAPRAVVAQRESADVLRSPRRALADRLLGS